MPLIRRLREEPGFSRNRNFEELSGPEAAQARRILRRLAGLRKDLEVAGSVELREDEDGHVLTLRFPTVRAKRITRLSREEHELLLGNNALPLAIREPGNHGPET